MLETIIGPKSSPRAVDQLLTALAAQPWRGRVYIGYPVLALEDGPHAVDALLTCEEHGIVLFDLVDRDQADDLEALRERQDGLHAALHASMLHYKPLLANRQLSVGINVVTVVAPGSRAATDAGAMDGVVTSEGLVELVSEFPGIPPDALTHVNAAIQRINAIRPPVKRAAPTRPNSRGAVMQRIEKEVANLDRWQEAAAIEAPDGPQRIRGLAGSGKTVVLAFKAAYLHARRPDWRIAVTFSTRSLYQQFTTLIERFYYEQMREKPNPERLHVLHSWGSTSEPGVYSRTAQRVGAPIRNMQYARATYGPDGLFDGPCREVLAAAEGRGIDPLYDVLLVDEAQDLPPSFFQLALIATAPPHRVVFAYDELQNLGDVAVASVSELFGSHPDGKPRIERLESGQAVARGNIILPVCYRNTPWALTVAHAVGFGVYRRGALVQGFDDPILWTEIGYEVVAGTLTPGQPVKLARAAASTPAFFKDLTDQRLMDPGDAVTCQVFPDAQEQAAWVAGRIAENLSKDDLTLRDILVVVANPFRVEKDAAPLVKQLTALGLRAHIVGVDSSRDQVFNGESVAISGIRRAKGNEAAMVYVLHAEYGMEPGDLARRRNTLFTAITRSRAWVRICGIGNRMEALKEEVEEVIKNGYQLAFTVPTPAELRQMRRIHRDMSDQERTLLRRGSRDLATIIQSDDPAVLHTLLDTLGPGAIERLQQALAQRDPESGQP